MKISPTDKNTHHDSLRVPLSLLRSSRKNKNYSAFLTGAFFTAVFLTTLGLASATGLATVFL